jgi:hypothetical protein
VKRFLGLLGAAGAIVVLFAACGGKVVVDAQSVSGTGGAGGSNNTITTSDGTPNPTTSVSVSASVSASVSVVASSSVTVGSGMTCDPSYTCVEAITPPAGNAGKLCEGTIDAKLYDALLQCTCADACATQCGGNVCVGFAPGANCNACLQDPVAGCGKQLKACANGS